MRKHDGLVVVQAACVAGLAWPGRGRWRLPVPVTAAAICATVTGAALTAASMASQGPQLTPRVEPLGGARFLTDGPYAISRHPMYVGVLLAGAGVAVLRRRLEPLAALAGLAAVLHVKTRLEERHLRDRFGAAYDDYADAVPRLVGRPRRAR